MPSPYTWDVNKPAGSDGLNQGDNQIRDDKVTLRDVLRTLVPFGTPTTGWRAVQINNEIWLTVNAKYTGTQWDRDDTSTTAHAIVLEPASDRIRIMEAGSGANPITWTEYAKFTGGSIEVAFKAVAQVFEGKAVTLTSDVKALYLIPTWNNGAVDFVGIYLDVTDTSSPAGARLMKLRVGGVDKFAVDKNGHIETASSTVVTNLNADTVDGLHKTGLSTKRRVAVLVVPGDPAAAAGVSIRLLMPVAGTITAIKSTVRTAPSSGTYTYDINKNGTTIYSTQANRPTRANADGTGAKTHTAPDVTTFSAGDEFSIDLDSGGSGIADIAFFIEFDETGQ